MLNRLLIEECVFYPVPLATTLILLRQAYALPEEGPLQVSTLSKCKPTHMAMSTKTWIHLFDKLRVHIYALAQPSWSMVWCVVM